jgi:predicted PurR-regulated permease PerM
MQNELGAQKDRQLRGYALRVAIAVGVVVIIGALLAVMWLTVDVLLLAFAGILLAVLLRGAANKLARHTTLSAGWSVLVVIVALMALIGAVGWFSASPVVQQADILVATMRQTAANLEQQVVRYQWGQWLVQEISTINWMSRRMDVVGKMTGAISSVFGILVDAIIIFFIGLYVAVQPRVYIDAAIRLVHPAGRPRVQQLVAEIGNTLQWWLVGIMVTMLAVGVMSGIGLWLLGVPFPLALGILAAVLAFVPYLGAIVASVPAMLVAMIRGPEYALYVAGLYLGIHLVEGYLLSPLIQQRAVSLPPAFLLFAQIMLGILLGMMGIVLAAPITATLLVAVKMLYVEDLIGETAEE